MSENAALAMRHLLVVDDDAAVADVMRMGLESDGMCRVTMAPGAVEALASIERDRPDAAIIDAASPQVPGLVLARTVIDFGVPVLIVSGDLAPSKRLGRGRLFLPPEAIPPHATRRRNAVATGHRHGSQAGGRRSRSERLVP